MAKAKRKTATKKKAEDLLKPTDSRELATLLGTSISGTAMIPAVGVTYELQWANRDGKSFASLRVARVSRKPNAAGLRATRLYP